ncbi:heptosyltransferase II [Candidatus Gastranaerophilus sp. (ex Termes propinquus)]|nr:heptosyltransferase II [Candidatus Gastranaerophilus sp. (ex Termes propinquus)]
MTNAAQNVLFINFGGIGDEILFLPAISSFKKEFPSAKITLCLEPRSRAIKDLTPLIDDLILVDIKARGIKKYFEILKMLKTVRSSRFDTVISSGKSPQVAVLEFLCGVKRRVGYKSKTSFLLTDSVELNENQYAAKMYHELVSPLSSHIFEPIKIEPQGEFELPKELVTSDFICIHPGVSKMSVEKNMVKCPKSSFWIELITKMTSKGIRTVLLGGPDDEEIIGEIVSATPESENIINLYGKTQNIAQLARIIQASKALVCVDSAPMHIGVGVGTKVIAIFGPTDEEKLIPKGDNFIVIKNKVDCDIRPCLWARRQTTCDTLECLNISPDEVLEHL